MSLQYFKNKVKDEVYFLYPDKHQSFYNLSLSFLMEVDRHMQNTQNRKLVLIFMQYIKKKVSQLLLCSIVMQNIHIFCGAPIMFVVICFWVVVVKNGCSLLDHGSLEPDDLTNDLMN